MSAYLRHCPQHWLFAESFLPFHAVDTFSAFPERRWLVISFLRIVFRRVRLVLCTGFSGDEPWSQERMPGPILSHFGQADNPRKLVVADDASLDLRLR